MRTLLLTFGLTVVAMTGFALWLSFCRRRLGKTPHGLSGICHKNGGRLCSSCADHLKGEQIREKEKSGAGAGKS